MKIDEEIKGCFRNDYHRGIINLTYTVNQLIYQFLQHLKKTQGNRIAIQYFKGFAWVSVRWASFDWIFKRPAVG